MSTSAIVKKLLGENEIIKKHFSISPRYIRLKLVISLFKWAVIFAVLNLLITFLQANWGRVFFLPSTGQNYDYLPSGNLANNLNSSILNFNSILGGPDFLPIWLLLAGIFLLIIAPLLFFYHLFYLPISNEFLFTNQRILIKRGWIGTRATSIHYNRITDVSISQGILDRLLHIGSLSISTAGSEGDRVALFHVAHPHNLKKELYDFKENYLNRQDKRQENEIGEHDDH